MKKLSKMALAVCFAGLCLTSCASYTAEDYLNDMKELTEETVRNASTYTEEDWKEVGEKYREINEKGKKVLEKMSKEQRKELEEISKEIADEMPKVDREALKKQVNEAIDRADEYIDGMLDKIKSDHR